MTSGTRWYLKWVNFEVTETGVKITCCTDIACHLWMRWTTEEPRIHLDPLYKRGVAFRAMPRYCFVSYHTNEQEEAGDTTIHTFIKEPWPVCQTRWFYFFGSIVTDWSPSESPLMSYHRVAAPITKVFYPDPHPEVTSVDGWAGVDLNHVPWATMHDHPGQVSSDSGTNLLVNLGGWTGEYPNTWTQCYRTIILFDTSSILPSDTLISAFLAVRGDGKTQSNIAGTSINVFSSNPAVNDDLVATDYSTLGSIPLAAAIAFADFNDTGFNIWPLNDAGLQAIAKSGITKLALREATYEAPNVPPAWVPNIISSFLMASSQPGITVSPYLSVTYKPA